MSDNPRVKLMQLLEKLATCFYMSKDSRLPLVILRSLKRTIKYGNCTYSGPAFMTIGVLLTGVLKDIQGGLTYGQHALTLLNMTKSHSSAARTMFLVYSFMFQWTLQSRLVLKPLLQAYDVGLRNWVNENALVAHFLLPVVASHSLSR